MSEMPNDLYDNLQFSKKKIMQQSHNKKDQWDVNSLGAVPYAINSGVKHLAFRPYWSEQKQIFMAPKTPLNKGFFYKFNSNIDIKLVRYTMEDNGLYDF